MVLPSRSTCRICNFARLSPSLRHRTLHTLVYNIPPRIPDPTSQDYIWAFFCRFIPLSCLFDSPARGPLPMAQLGSGRAHLIEKLELELDNPRNSVLWLHGPPGTGKSVIAYTLASRYRQKHRLAGSFSFSRRHANCKSAHSVVLALAYQLGLSEPLVKEKIITALNNDPGIILPSRDLREQFARLLVEPLETVDWRFSSRALVIDAVDQCQDQTLDLISLLTRLLSHLTDVGLHIFFASRDEVFIKRHSTPVTSMSIERQFAIVTLHTTDRQVSLPRIDINSDIRSFLCQSFKKIYARHRLQCRKPWPPDDVLDHLVNRIGPYFGAASVVVRFIESLDHDPTDRMDLIYHILTINPSLHPGSLVDDLYESIISTSDDIKQAYLHLAIVASLPGMLSCSQLDNLLNRGTNQKFDMCSVLSRLSPLVHIPASDGAVQICHESLCDYLCDPLRCGERLIPQALVHRLLAYSSLSIMVKELPDDSTISSRLSQLTADSTSLNGFDDESVLSLVVYLPPDPLQLLFALPHIMQHGVTGLTADPRTTFALGYFCSAWQILQHFELSAFNTLLPSFRFLKDLRSLPVLLAFPIFLSFESLGNGQIPGSSSLQNEPRIGALNAVAEIVNHLYALKDECRTGSGALDYACTHWAYHLSLAEWDDDLRSILTTFISQKLEKWLVRAWCLQNFVTCLRILYNVRELCLTATHFGARSTDANMETITTAEEAEAETQYTLASAGEPSRATEKKAYEVLTEPQVGRKAIESNSTFVCMWRGPSRLCCNNLFNVHNLPSHLRTHYGSNKLVFCRWGNCSRVMRRDTIARHVKEVHLGIRRSRSNTRVLAGIFDRSSKQITH
ncbi:hypothetical protein M405DRAFT_525354 [Rhizopogon salebrosus TDB-379]|nr:hypothetical protein M405DRAFT_525354 [Rhizopogon salebrosus TDB-379]